MIFQVTNLAGCNLNFSMHIKDKTERGNAWWIVSIEVATPNKRQKGILGW